jgi:hypothetical protein
MHEVRPRRLIRMVTSAAVLSLFALGLPNIAQPASGTIKWSPTGSSITYK